MALQGCAGTFGIFSCSWVNSYNVLSIAGFFPPLLRNSNSRRFLPQPWVSADMEINISIVAHSYPISLTPLLQGPSSCPWKTVMCTGEVCKKRYGVTVLDFFLMYFIKYNSDWLNDWLNHQSESGISSCALCVTTQHLSWAAFGFHCGKGSCWVGTIWKWRAKLVLDSLAF